MRSRPPYASMKGRIDQARRGAVEPAQQRRVDVGREAIALGRAAPRSRAPRPVRARCSGVELVLPPGGERRGVVGAGRGHRQLGIPARVAEPFPSRAPSAARGSPGTPRRCERLADEVGHGAEVLADQVERRRPTPRAPASRRRSPSATCAASSAGRKNGVPSDAAARRRGSSRRRGRAARRRTARRRGGSAPATRRSRSRP